MVALIRQPEAICETTLQRIRMDPRLVETDPRQPRRDALPEHTNYHDSGCDLHSSCLSCPLVRCRYDEPGGARQLLSKDRDEEVLSLQRRGGRSIEEIARHAGVSRRTVFRILARARTEGSCS